MSELEWTVISSLHDKTGEEKISWKTWQLAAGGIIPDTSAPRYPEGPFATHLDKFTVKIGKTADGEVRLWLDEDGSISISSQTDDEGLSEILHDLYDRVRRQALGIDEKLTDLKNLLDQL